MHSSLVCVHGLGTKADEAFYNPVTGKTWIQDADFLSQLIGPVRVWTFTFNSDMAANLSAPCIAFQGKMNSANKVEKMRRAMRRIES